MDVQISGRNIKITQGLEEFTQNKIERLERYLPNIRDIRVDLALQHNSRGEDMSIAQITVHHKRGAILRAEEKTAGEMHHAIESAVDKMYRQIVRFKGKRRDKKRRGRYGITTEELAMAEPMPFEAEDEEEATIDTTEAAVEPYLEDIEQEVNVVRRKQIALIPMDEYEAIEQMELLGHSFFMFFNANTGKVNVLYRREDTGYGLLEPTEA